MDIYSVLAIAIAPLAAAVLFGVIGGGIRLFIAKYIPDCWLKRQLLAERIKTKYSAANGRIAMIAAMHTNGWRDRLKPKSTSDQENPPQPIVKL